jgi:UDP-N-acetylglucosamine 2-epimerase
MKFKCYLTLLLFPLISGCGNSSSYSDQRFSLEESAVMMVGVNKERILQGLKILESRDPNVIKTPLDYQADNVSEKVLSIIVGYVDYVNANVWHK